jgi:hypothetical protein
MMKRRRFILISSSACLVSSLPGCSFFDSPSKTIKLFFERLEKDEILKAKELLSKSFLDSVSESGIRLALSEIAREIQQGWGIKSIEIENEKITGEVAQVEFSVEFKKSQPKKGNADLVKEDGIWKIGDF